MRKSILNKISKAVKQCGIDERYVLVALLHELERESEDGEGIADFFNAIYDLDVAVRKEFGEW